MQPLLPPLLSLNDFFPLGQPQHQCPTRSAVALRPWSPLLSFPLQQLLSCVWVREGNCSAVFRWLQTLVKKVVSLLLSCNDGNGAKEFLHANTWNHRPESYTHLGCQVCDCSPQPVPAAEVTAPSNVSSLLVCVITPSPTHEVCFYHFLFLIISSLLTQNGLGKNGANQLDQR